MMQACLSACKRGPVEGPRVRRGADGAVVVLRFQRVQLRAELCLLVTPKGSGRGLKQKGFRVGPRDKGLQEMGMAWGMRRNEEPWME